MAAARRVPAHPVQTLFWVAEGLRPGSSNQSTQIAWPGTVDVDRLRRSAHSVAARRDAVRIAVVPSVGAADLSAALEDDPWSALQQVVVDEVDIPVSVLGGDEATFPSEPFDLETPPLLRLVVIREDGLDDRVRIEANHSVIDAVSFDLLWDDLRSFYEGGEGPDAAPSYADHVVAQRAEWASGAWAPRNQAWADAMSDLPGNQLPPGNRSIWPLSKSIAFGLDVEGRHAFEAAVTSWRTTRFAVATAMLCGALGRVCAWREVVLTTIVSTRRGSSFRVVGPLVDAVLVRLPCEGALADIATAGRRSQLESVATRFVPFVVLRAEIPEVRRALDTEPRIVLRDRAFASRRVDEHAAIAGEPGMIAGTPLVAEAGIDRVPPMAYFGGDADLLFDCNLHPTNPRFQITFRADRIDADLVTAIALELQAIARSAR